jgi:hypothetical protein
MGKHAPNYGIVESLFVRNKTNKLQLEKRKKSWTRICANLYLRPFPEKLWHNNWEQQSSTSHFSSAVEQLIRNQQVEGSNPLSGSLECGMLNSECGMISASRVLYIPQSEFRIPHSKAGYSAAR